MNKLEYFKQKGLSILDGPEDTDVKDFKKSFTYIVDVVAKGNFPVGTIREWKGKKYVKIAPGKWRPKYDSHSRGAKLSIAVLKRKAEQCKTSQELLQLVLENRDRFSNKDGRPLPFVKELSDYVSRLNDKVENKKVEENIRYFDALCISDELKDMNRHNIFYADQIFIRKGKACVEKNKRKQKRLKEEIAEMETELNCYVERTAKMYDDRRDAIRKIDAWIKELDSVRNLKIDDIYKIYDNTLEPIAYLHGVKGFDLGETNSIYEQAPIYCGMAYFIDHAINHHPEVKPKEYLFLQKIIDNADAIYSDEKMAAIYTQRKLMIK